MLDAFDCLLNACIIVLSHIPLALVGITQPAAAAVTTLKLTLVHIVHAVSAVY